MNLGQMIHTLGFAPVVNSILIAVVGMAIGLANIHWTIKTIHAREVARMQKCIEWREIIAKCSLDISKVRGTLEQCKLNSHPA